MGTSLRLKGSKGKGKSNVEISAQTSRIFKNAEDKSV